MAEQLQFYVVGLQGQKHPVSLAKNNSTAELFQLILRNGITPAKHPSELRLVCEGQEVENDTRKALSQYNIKNQSCIYALIRLKEAAETVPEEEELQFYVVGLQGKKHLMTMPKSSTAAELFAKVIQKGVTPARDNSELRLIYESQELQNDPRRLLTHFGIKNLGSVYAVVRVKGGQPFES